MNDNRMYLLMYQRFTSKGYAELSVDFGVTRGCMQFWLTGERAVPSWVVRVIKLITTGKLTIEQWRDSV